MEINFNITEQEQKKIEKWKAKHIKKKHKNKKYSGAISGTYTYEFTPTSIGDVGVIRCSCGEEFCFKEL